jgi:hypothetical protein
LTETAIDGSLATEVRPMRFSVRSSFAFSVPLAVCALACGSSTHGSGGASSMSGSSVSASGAGTTSSSSTGGGTGGSASVCGDHTCDADETCSTCPADCGKCPGWCIDYMKDITCNPFTENGEDGTPCGAGCIYAGNPYNEIYCTDQGPSPSVPVGEACDELSNAPLCVNGALCVDPTPGEGGSDGICVQVCCAESDCTAGGHCTLGAWLSDSMLGACQ